MAKVELIKELPSDPTERKRLQGIIQEIVDAKLQIDSFQQIIKDILEVEKEDNCYDPSMIKFYADLEFDVQYKEGKKAQKIDEAAEKKAELDILMGR